MKSWSNDFVSVLQRAAYDNHFAKEFINSPEKALRLYNITNSKERKYLESLNDITILKKEYKEYLKVNHRISPRIFYFGIVLFVIAILLVVYLLISFYIPGLLPLLGLPLWTSLFNSSGRFLYNLFILLTFSISVLILIIYLPQMEVGKRAVLLIVDLTIGFFIGAVLIGLIPPDTRIIMIRVLLTLIFTILPASLYPIFITSKSMTLREEFTNNLARLDPVSFPGLQSIYTKKFNAIYGPPDKSGFYSSLLQSEASFPVLLTTFIIGLGWIVFFFIGDILLLYPMDHNVSAFTYGFIGAYIFSLEFLFRRYVQSDLKSTAYTHVGQRILLTWVWSSFLIMKPWEIIGITNTDSNIVFILAFAVGIFPDIAWQILGQTIKKILGTKVKSFQEEFPLSDIDGITIWVEARLKEESVENIENLVTTGVVDLMLRTNMKPERIIHWIDQGVLKLHLGGIVNKEFKIALLNNGILTATDLFYAYSEWKKNNQDPLLDKSFYPLVKNLAAEIQDDPNMYHVLAWRNFNNERINRLGQAIKTQLEHEIVKK